MFIKYRRQDSGQTTYKQNKLLLIQKSLTFREAIRLHFQRNTIAAAMDAKVFIQSILENRGLVIMNSLDVQNAFESSSWPAILQGLRTFNCPRNLYNLSNDFFSKHKSSYKHKNFTIDRHQKGISSRNLLRTRIPEHTV